MRLSKSTAARCSRRFRYLGSSHSTASSYSSSDCEVVWPRARHSLDGREELFGIVGGFIGAVRDPLRGFQERAGALESHDAELMGELAIL